MNIIEFRHDPKLLGALPHMRDLATQTRWDVFLKAVYGLALDADALAIFREHTNRTTPRAGGYPEAVLITGRQRGKSQTAADVVAFEAAMAPRDGSADGTFALLVAQDQRGAIRTLLKYIATPFERVPMLSRLKVSATADTITLDSGVMIGAWPCRPASTRGARARVAVIDELAFFRGSDGNPVDTEMLRAVRPTLATTNGKLIILSSPYAQAGALWDLHRAHYGREDSEILVWAASAPAMNPGLPPAYLRRLEANDPEAARAEIDGEFRTGLSTLFEDPAALDAITGEYRERLPVAGVSYHCFADPSGGRGDATTLAVAHGEGEHVIVDAVRAWRGDTDVAAAEASAFVKSYNTHTVTGDNYGADLTVKNFARNGITYVPRPPGYEKSRLFLELLPRVLSGAVTIPNDEKLLRELRGLERRRGFAGRDRVDHRLGAHDDRANACAGAVWLVAQAMSSFIGDFDPSINDSFYRRNERREFFDT